MKTNTSSLIVAGIILAFAVMMLTISVIKLISPVTFPQMDISIPICGGVFFCAVGAFYGRYQARKSRKEEEKGNQ